jgi:hypothetical protein
VQTVGAVLNGVPARHYAYRYGSYYYTRRPIVGGKVTPVEETQSA